MNKSFELIRLFGQPVLYSRNRVSDSHIPQTVHRYEMAKASGDDRMEICLERHAYHGYCGTIISKFPVPKSTFHSDEDLDDTCILMTVEDYLDDRYEPLPEPDDKIRVLIIEPWKQPEVAFIPNTCGMLQAIVGGPIEVVCPFDDTVVLVVNAIGKLVGLPLNREINNDIVAGTFLICGTDPHSDGFVSLTDEQVEHFSDLFRSIEIFVPQIKR